MTPVAITSPVVVTTSWRTDVSEVARVDFSTFAAVCTEAKVAESVVVVSMCLTSGSIGSDGIADLVEPGKFILIFLV